MLWRHGDLLIAAVAALPARVQRRPGVVLARGERTGHCHRIAERGAAELWEGDAALFLRVRAEEAHLVHPEHAPIALPRGSYRVWRQREYAPAAFRPIAD